jgi:hypothetical protein
MQYIYPIMITYEQHNPMIQSYIERLNSNLFYNYDNLPERGLKAFHGFKNFANRLYNFRSNANNSTNEILKIKREIEAIRGQELSEKLWLLNKVEELIGK